MPFVRGNHLPFINKTLSKAIMHWTRFCNKYLRNKTAEIKRNDTNNEITVPHFKEIKERILQ